MRWDARTKVIARAIPEGVSILDLGGGFGRLARCLKENRNGRYISLDLKPWTDATIVADFNKGEYPDVGKYHYLVAQGIIEYMKDKEQFLESIKKYGSMLLITHNGYKKEKFKELLKKTKWEIVFSRPVPGSQKLYYCYTK